MSNRQIDASVVVCTYNRAESLRRTLKGVLEQQLDKSTLWEIIVVDNNSSDNTRQVVADLQRQSSKIPMRYEFEQRQGLSHARNRGVACARGKFILFTDDDVSAEPHWLAETLLGMAQYACEAGGGWIGPVWAKPRPPWLSQRFYGFLALRTDEDGPKSVIDIQEAPFGANMVFRKRVFDRFGLFATDRGRVGATLWSGEDTELFQRLLAAGAKVMYFPKARVFHHIDQARMKKRYFWKWRFHASCNEAKTGKISSSRQLLGVPLYIFRQGMVAAYQAIASRFYRNPPEVLHREMILSHFLGTIYGLSTARAQNRR
jgi:glycosyltransferase involved in cell wall biosynthesis